MEVLDQGGRLGERGDHVDQVMGRDRTFRESAGRVEALEQWLVGLPRLAHRRHQLQQAAAGRDDGAAVEFRQVVDAGARGVDLLDREPGQAKPRMGSAVDRLSGDRFLLLDHLVGVAVRHQQAPQGQVHLRSLVGAVVHVAILQRFEVGLEEQHHRLVGHELVGERRRRRLARRRLEIRRQQLESLTLGVAGKQERVARLGLLLRRRGRAGRDRHRIGAHAIEHCVVLGDQMAFGSDRDAARQFEGPPAGIPVGLQAADDPDADQA